MALTGYSLFLYNYTITANNRYITFNIGGSNLTATLTIGFYSLTSLLIEIESALSTADLTSTYTVTANRAIAGGTQNRVTIASSAATFNILFFTGNPSNPATLLGFAATDQTGATSYTGSSSSGTVLLANQYGYSYLPPAYMQKNFGSVNVSASGLKEAIVFQLQNFIQVQFKIIPDATAMSQWSPLITWMIQQQQFDFTPSVSTPNTFYPVTLEDPNGGLQMNLTEMLPDFPFYFQTPLMKFRVVVD